MAGDGRDQAAPSKPGIRAAGPWMWHISRGTERTPDRAKIGDERQARSGNVSIRLPAVEQSMHILKPYSPRFAREVGQQAPARIRQCSIWQTPIGGQTAFRVIAAPPCSGETQPARWTPAADGGCTAGAQFDAVGAFTKKKTGRHESYARSRPKQSKAWRMPYARTARATALFRIGPSCMDVRMLDAFSP